MEHARNRGLPAAAIRITPPVQNTAEEAQAVAAMLKGASSPHILLVTSAFHMPRAQAQFEAQGLRVTPYPVDFRARIRSFTILDLLPDAEALDNTSIAFREALGRAFYAVTAALRS